MFVSSIGRHDGANIKKEYDKVIQYYDLSNKVFKIITDQAANMRKAFQNENEANETDEIIKLTKELLLNQIKEDLKTKQDILKDELIKEIDSFNASSAIKSNPVDKMHNKRMNSDQVLTSLLDLDDDIDDIPDTVSDHDTSSDSLKDAEDELPGENLNNLIKEFLLEDEISKF